MPFGRAPDPAGTWQLAEAGVDEAVEGRAADWRRHLAVLAARRNILRYLAEHG